MNEPKNTMLTPAQMQEMVSQKQGSRLYSKDTDAQERVQMIVSQLSKDLASIPQKINLRDSDMVKSIAIAYCNACAEKGVIPSRSGLCRCLGYSRQGIDYFLLHHEQEPSAEVLRIVFDGLADALSQSALTNSTNMVFSLFLLKALYGYRDTVSIETELKHDPYETRRRSAEEIMREYAEIGLPD